MGFLRKPGHGNNKPSDRGAGSAPKAGAGQLDGGTGQKTPSPGREVEPSVTGGVQLITTPRGPKVALRTAFTSASYGEAVLYIANLSAMAEPNINVIRMLSWLFDVPVGEVKKNLRDVWSSFRKSEQNERESSGSRRR